jgi:hypothetical protein
VSKMFDSAWKIIFKFTFLLWPKLSHFLSCK